MYSETLLNNGGIIFICIYLFSLLFIGFLGHVFKKENSLEDFYLANRGMGGIILFLTLYATQYSGNTLIGFSGQAYRQGFNALVTVTFMCAIVGVYFIFAPKLYNLSKQYKFITLGDFISYRFNSKHLTLLISMISIVALGNYILTNLKAIGFIAVGITGGKISFINAVIVLSIIMVIYETLGGMRSVAWTDTIQGILLLLGVSSIFFIIIIQYGSLSSISSSLKLIRPEFWDPPNYYDKIKWFSTIIIVSIGVAVYPHAIQRIYSAKSASTLKRSLQIMIFMPFVTTLFMIIVGVVGATQIYNLNKLESEQIAILLLSDLVYQLPAISWLIALFFGAALAAIMSTVDSALLAISSIITKDIFNQFKPKLDQKSLLVYGKMISWLIMLIAVIMAITLPNTIWQLFQIKLELLCQIAPAVIIGIHIESINYKSILVGIYFGVLVSLFFMIGNWFTPYIVTKPYGIHAGLWGLIVNCIIIYSMHQINKKNN